AVPNVLDCSNLPSRSEARFPGICRLLRPERRWADPDHFSEHARKVTRILKAGIESGLSHTSHRIAQAFFRMLDPPQKDILVGCAAGALSEQFSKVMRAHPSYSRKLRKGKITGQVLSDVIQHTV